MLQNPYASGSFFWSASQHHYQVFPILPKMRQKLTMQILYDGFPKILDGLLYACLHLPLGADEVEWILVMAARHCYIQ
jgi:hypothetical protein